MSEVIEAPVTSAAPADAAATPAVPAAAATPDPAPVPEAAAQPAAQPASEPAKVEPDAKGYWPEDWREKASKGDEKLLKRFGRYASPEAALEALVQAQNKISAAQFRPGLKKDASPEEIAEWRKEVGIPEKPDQYSLAGMDDVTEESKPFYDALLKHAHDSNQTQAQLDATLRAWKEMRNAAVDLQAENDKRAESLFEDTLRQEWGPEYRTNINAVHNLLNATANQELKASFLEARLPDGSKLGTNPEAMRFLLAVALKDNPAATVVPASHGSPLVGIDEEIARIDKMMRTDRAAYNKDDKLQARYRELWDAKMKLQNRA
jgi:hypothetical protein